MADKGWTARVAIAAGAAAGTGAAQLGLGYGLGVVVWPVTPTPDDSAWLGSLGWATWITASATVFGAVLGSRYRGGPGSRTSAAWRFALAACAAVGALVTVALIALPARSAVRVDTFSPQVIAGGYAAVGLVLGLVVAFWAVSSRPVAANLMATGVWLWALAVAAIVVELTTNRDSATYLTSWQFAEVASSGRYGTIYWPSALLTLAAAFLVGVLAATPAARRGNLGVGAATSGAAGPLLVAIAFLALAPRLTGALGPIESAYLIAPYAVLAGLAGSALAVATARALANRRTQPTPTTDHQVPDGDRSIPAAMPLPRTGESAPPTASSPTGVAKVPDAPAADAASFSPQTKPKTGLFGRKKPSTPEPDQVISPEPGPAPKKDSKPAPAPRTNGKPAPHVTDSEIAAAARPRPRPRKATTPPESPKPPKSTVTPPPPTPAVAQINPKPTPKD
ncbi:Hansenula MRAKII killer toxin-resistant protein 1 [Actinoplanes sp. Pm04-4]|uniref:Hansenula MRAKII killer toxin-resistant protein 1 n=1 Tax=Paractinoplanes pyxinae TaxID=2997416 RepID=A0ABT4BBL4_9ACTN|nr:Hansenula MRAKII killer toxin-resistant protein 1 [Actinoplanes pyxinae]MCY1143913.1 Hansenula MRAKII killer toxin-resistant protein 1 [Actinoplanes pyxinae]